MAVFPDLAPSTLSPQAVFRNIRVGTDGDFTQRRKKRNTPLMRFSLSWKRLSQADLTTLWDFYCARYGGYGAFAFFDPDERIWSEFEIGKGTGSQTVFDLKAKTTSNRAIKVDGVLKTEGVHYTFTAGGGTDGQDKITFGTPPVLNASVTASYTGRKYYAKMIFEEDSMSYEVLAYVVTCSAVGLSIVEVTE